MGQQVSFTYRVEHSGQSEWVVRFREFKCFCGRGNVLVWGPCVAKTWKTQLG